MVLLIVVSAPLVEGKREKAKTTTNNVMNIRARLFYFLILMKMPNFKSNGTIE